MKRFLVYFGLTLLVAVYCVVWQMQNGVKRSERADVTGEVAAENDGPGPEPADENADPEDFIASTYPELQYVFPETDDWRRRHPYVFHSISDPEDARYFFLCGKEPSFVEQPDGCRLVVSACTFVVFPKAKLVEVADESGAKHKELESTESRAKRALVVEIENEISLALRGSLYDFKRLKTLWNPANIQGGNIAGKVVVRSGDFYDEESADSAFRIDASEITFTGRQLRTTQDVAIHFGRHTCKGTGLTIDFNISGDIESILKDKKKESEKDVAAELADPSLRVPKVPQNLDELDAESDDYLLDLIDQVVEDGNVGGGFSIRSVVLDKLQNVDGLVIYAKNKKSDDGDDDGKDDNEPAFDHVEISCDGSMQFAPVERNPGEWCLRLANNVRAVAIDESESQSVASFNGSSLQFFFKDPLLEKLETSKFPEVRKALNQRKPSGSLARLDASVLRVFDEDLDDDGNAFSAAYTPKSNNGARTFCVRALQFYYNLRTGDGCLLNTLESESVRSNLGNARPSELLISETNADGEEQQTSIATPILFVKISEDDELRYLKTTGSGTLKTTLRVADSGADSHFVGGHVAAYPQQTFASQSVPGPKTSGKKRTRPVPVSVTWENGLTVEPETSAEAVVALSALGGGSADAADSVYRLTTSGAVKCDADEFGQFNAPEMNLWFRLSHEDKKSDASYQQDDREGGYAFHPICVKFSKTDAPNANPLDNVVLSSERGTMEIDEALEILFSDLDASKASDNQRAALPALAKNSQDGGGNDLGSFREGSGTFKLTSRRVRLFCQLSAEALNSLVDDKKKGDAGGKDSAGSAAPVRVTRVELTGGVEFEERDNDGKTTANVSGESLLVDNPQTPEMRMILAGSANQNALCRAKDLNLRGRTIVVDAKKNEFSVAGAGAVEITPKTKPNHAANVTGAQNPDSAPAVQGDAFSALAAAGPINVMWSKEMRFDGRTMCFSSSPDKAVSVTTSDAMLECAETRLVLHSAVDLLELQYDGEHGPDVDYVECVGSPSSSVRMRFNAPSKTEDAAVVGPYSGFYRLECSSVRLYVESQKFVVDNQGRIAATIYSPSGGVASADPAGLSKLSEEDIRRKIQEDADKQARKKAGTYVPDPVEDAEEERLRLAKEKERKAPKWVRVNASFDSAEGSLKDYAAQIDGRVNALVCDVESPETTVNFDDSSTWTPDFITFQCNRANFSAVENAGRKDVEFVASDNVSFRSGFMSGYCRKLSYDASKNVATLVGDETAPVKLVRQEYSGARREPIAEFAQGKINLKEKTFEVEDAEVSSGFNPAAIKEQIDNSRRLR